MALLSVSCSLLRGVESVAVVDGQDVQCLLPVADLAGEVLAVAASGGRDEVEDLRCGLLVPGLENTIEPGSPTPRTPPPTAQGGSNPNRAKRGRSLTGAD